VLSVDAAGRMFFSNYFWREAERGKKSIGCCSLIFVPKSLVTHIPFIYLFAADTCSKKVWCPVALQSRLSSSVWILYYEWVGGKWEKKVEAHKIYRICPS